MPCCAVSNCKNSSRTVNMKSRGISYHRFPRDPNVKSKWIDATGRRNWFPSKYSTICSFHFGEEDYDISKGKRLLLPKACPKVEVWFNNSTDNATLSSASGSSAPVFERFCEKQPTELSYNFANKQIDHLRREKLLRRVIELKNNRINEQRLKIKRVQSKHLRCRKKIDKLQSLQNLKEKLPTADEGDLETRTLRTRPEVSPWTKSPVERPSKSYRKKGSYRKRRRSDDGETKSETGETKSETGETEPGTGETETETGETELESEETEEQDDQPAKKRGRPLRSRSVSHDTNEHEERRHSTEGASESESDSSGDSDSDDSLRLHIVTEHKKRGRPRTVKPKVRQDGPKKIGRPVGATNANRFPENRVIITRVYHYLEKEYEQLKANCGNCDLTPFSNILQRTALATGVSEASVSALLEKEQRAKAKRKIRKEHKQRMKEQASSVEITVPVMQATPQPQYQVVVKHVQETVPENSYYHHGILRERSPHIQEGHLAEGSTTIIRPPIDEEHETRLAVDNIICTTDPLSTPSLPLSDTLIIKTEPEDTELAGTSGNTPETLLVVFKEEDT